MADTPSDFAPRRSEAVDHSSLMQGPFASGQEVTRACLVCHESAATEAFEIEFEPKVKLQAKRAAKSGGCG